MNARFVRAGSRITTTPAQALTNPGSWQVISPMSGWSVKWSSATHSGQASVTIPQHGAISPSDARTRPTGTLNTDDIVFLQDLSRPTSYGGAIILHGIVDNIEYVREISQGMVLKVYFRDMTLYLAEDRGRAGVPLTLADWGGFAPPFPPYKDMKNGTYQYFPNYVSLAKRAVGSDSILREMITNLVWAGSLGANTSNNAGPFDEVLMTDPFDGDPEEPNFDKPGIKLLDAIVQMLGRVRWADNSGFGHDMISLADQSGAGFGTTLYTFRRGNDLPSALFDQGNTAFRHGKFGGIAHEIPIIDYNFPDQAYDMPDMADALGHGDVTVKDLMQVLNSTASPFSPIVSSMVSRGVAAFGPNASFSAGRKITITDEVSTTVGALVNNILSKMEGIGAYKKHRVGSIRVGGWVQAATPAEFRPGWDQLIPGKLIKIRIPEAGIEHLGGDELMLVDEWEYSEPEGITTIHLNRKASLDLSVLLAHMDKRTQDATSAAKNVYDTGWFDWSGNPETGQKTCPDLEMHGAPTWSAIFNYRSGVMPAKIEVLAGIKNLLTGKVFPFTVFPPPSGYPSQVNGDPQYIGTYVSCSGAGSIIMRMEAYVGYNDGIAAWVKRDDPALMMRIKVTV